MFDTTALTRQEPADSIPPAVQARFAELARAVQSRTVLCWGEHCTECAFPGCYSSCQFYAPRADMHCRRFEDGIVSVKGHDVQLMKVNFKQWARLEAIGANAVTSASDAGVIESRNLRWGKALLAAPLPHVVKRSLLWRRSWSTRGGGVEVSTRTGAPEYFVVEAYHSQPGPVDLLLSVLPAGKGDVKQYQQRIALAPGYSRTLIPAQKIRDTVDLNEQYLVQLSSADGRAGIDLYFGLLDFASLQLSSIQPEKPANGKLPQGPAPKAKCIVWDLDNTLWDGVLIEDGIDKLKLREDTLAVIRELDRRGVLHSVVSKNGAADGLAALRRFGIEDFFLHPQISWEPKSQGIQKVAQAINIGLDSLAFVDDSSFERAEVSAMLPCVRIFSETDVASLATHPAFDYPVTEEGKNRRAMYRQEIARAEVREATKGDYLAFVRDCRLVLTLRKLETQTLDRAQELTQRTNQMNFSGNRYERVRLEEIARTETLEAFVLSCTDRFGDYGTIGLAVFDRAESRLIDLMFSCRVQGKRVEHAFLSHLLKREKARGKTKFFANYRKTDRNSQAGKVFADLGFTEAEAIDGVLRLEYDLTQPVLDEKAIEIVDER